MVISEFQKMLEIAAAFSFVRLLGKHPTPDTEDAIGSHFSQAGHVTNVRIVYYRKSGRPKGFGFCEFSDEAGAQNAANTLNGTDFNGRSLRVNLPRGLCVEIHVSIDRLNLKLLPVNFKIPAYCAAHATEQI
ncbi:unnamed protein product [Heligmosomoides polygyrus]|uniref:RRM domain-containing protein n=1 Tax=Heligmosomoides polygyrus TaxID=6339 RepID=A0A3P8A5R2_HELPZ|nr:unnamed protein product [Heligmosomoides polygyrus]